MADEEGAKEEEVRSPLHVEEEQLRKEKEALELQLADSQKALEELRKENEALSKGGSSKSSSRSWVLDVAIGECEFASAFAYFLEVQIEGHAEKRCTDVSSPSERPVFANSSLLLAVGTDFAEEKLQVSAFLNVVDPSSGQPAAKLLGTGLLSLQELKVSESATTSKRLMRTVSFTRVTEGGEGKHLVVGRATIVMQVKCLSSEAPIAGLDHPHTVASGVAPSLDKTLWQMRQFEHRLHVLVHRVDGLPVPEASAKALIRVAARLLQPGGYVLQELASRSLPVEPVTASTGEVWFNQEIVLPLSASSDASGPQIGLAVEMVSATPEGAMTDSLLSLQWSPTSLPYLSPLHLHARASGTSASASRPRPGLLVSLTREPGHEVLDGLAGGISHGLEIRVHGVPHGRPLPDLVEGAVVAVCPESSVGVDMRELQVPVATYLYDQRVELSAFLDEHFISAASQLRCFLTPLSGASRTPQWGQFLLHCSSSAAALKAATLLLFECRGVRADPDMPLRGNVLGFASLDASSLMGSEPLSRSFLLDLRLLEAPGASTSLEIEARVWPRGSGGSGVPGKASAAAVLPATGTAATESQDFRLNTELSAQLSKEFNLRAAALKRAGEEIVTLRRQVQLLKNENRSLRAQVEEEEKLAQDVQHRPPPEGLEKLSSAELAGKLQRTLEKYREEKAKASELSRRMEDALKEVNRARGLERSLEELQQVHLEQNRGRAHVSHVCSISVMESPNQEAEPSPQVLTKRQSLSWLAKQPTRRRFGSTRFARWSWLEPCAGRKIQPGEEPDWPLPTEAKAIPQNTAERVASEKPDVSWPVQLETVHEERERHQACQCIAKALAAQFGCEAQPERLEDLLAGKEAEIARLKEEVAALTAEKEAAETALEAAEAKLVEAAKTKVGTVSKPTTEEISPPAPAKQSAQMAQATEPSRVHVIPVDISLPPEEGISGVQGGGPREQVAAIRREREEGIQSDYMREMFLGCVELLAADIYASRAHFVLELLQNADDNEYAEGVEAEARFLLRREAGSMPYIAVVNNEIGLTAQDLVGMCAISKSAKKEKADRTGRKGIGFKSVFAVSSCPHVLSREYTFKFDVRNDRMGYVMPTWIDEEELKRSVPDEIQQLHKEGFTVIYLPVSNSSDALLSEVEGHLEALDPATLLFMRRLRRIEFHGVSGSRTSLRAQERGRAGLQREVVSAEGSKGDRQTMTTFEFYVGRRHTQGVFGDTGATRPLTIALPVPDSAGAPQRAFATLPLCHTGLGVCINADWDVSASRDGVHENAHNELLATEAAKAFADIARELGAKLLPASPVDYLGDRAPLSRFWRRVRERFIAELLRADVPCLLAEDGHGSGAHYVAASAALRRPSPTAPPAEQASAALIPGPTLKAAIGRCFVREPLPQGVQVESFTASHYARCLAKLTEAALAHGSFGQRVCELTKLYTALEGLLSETGLTRPELHKIQDRADLARTAACWPCKSAQGKTIICAASHGPIFADIEATVDPLPLLPTEPSEAQHRWRLRLLLPEAAEALKSTSRLAELCQVRTLATSWHLVGLALELHGLQTAEDRAQIQDATWWLSLRVVRDAWQSFMLSSTETAQATSEEEQEVDVLVVQGRALMDPDRLKAILFLPSASGLLHAPAVCCQLVIGEQVLLHEGSLPPLRLPSSHPAEALRETLSWERFFQWLGAAEPPLTRNEAVKVTAKLLDPDWWLLVEASARPQLPWLLIRISRLPAPPLDLDGCWELSQCLSADFAPFLLGVQLCTKKGSAAAPPLCSAKGGEFAPEARRCLGSLGVTLDVNARSLRERCLEPMLEAVEAKLLVPLANFRRVYAAFQAQPGSHDEWRASLQSRIYVPDIGVQHADNCVYLPANLDGMGELLGRNNLQPLYPGLRDFFVNVLGVSSSLSAQDCLTALQTLRKRSEGAGTLSPMASGLFTALMDMSKTHPSLQAEIKKEMQIPVPARDGSGLRWLAPQRCMWLDVPSGMEIGVASLEAHYAPQLRPFFVDMIGIPLLSSVEVQTRLRTAASNASAEATSNLHKAYQDLEKLCQSIDDEGSEDVALLFLKKDLSDMVFLPGVEHQPEKDAFVFLSSGHPDLAAHSGKIDLGLHFQGLDAYFTRMVGLPSFLDVDCCLRTLRNLQSQEDCLSLVLAIYSNLQQAHGCSMQVTDFSLVFEEEPLVYSPGTERSVREVAKALKDRSPAWRRSVDCMWHNVPSGVEVGCRSLEGRLPADLEDFCVELLGVPALSPVEVAARLDLVRRTTSQADIRSNGPSCEHHVVTAYLEILSSLQHRLAAGSQFRNPKLIDHLRERVFIPDVGYVNAKKCRWRAASSLRGRPEFYELGEIYGESSRWSGETSQLHRYFVFWLGVPTALTLEESLDQLRELKSSSRFSQLQDAPEGSVLSRAATLYREVAAALNFSRTSAKEASDAAEELRTQGLIFVPGAEPSWRKADQCLWAKPSKCPEGWSTQREELAAPYAEDASLKELFTVRLGIPVSVRFEGTQQLQTVPLQGQPCWLLESTDAPLREPADESPFIEQASSSRLVDEVEDAPLPAAHEPVHAAPSEETAKQTVTQEHLQTALKQAAEEENMVAPADDVPPPPEPFESSVQIRGAASDGRRQRRRMLEKLASSVLTIQDNRQMKSRPNQVKHRSEACLDCNPQHDLYKVGVLASQWNKDVSIPVWVERNGQDAAIKRLKAAMASAALDRFADLLAAVSELFSVPCIERVHIFEEDTQTVAFNGGALFFNLRYFIEENHASNWEEAVSFWAVSFAHELAHFESPLHDRQHGRAMEMSQRAVLPGLARVLSQPWGAAVGARDVAHRKWTLQGSGGSLMS